MRITKKTVAALLISVFASAAISVSAQQPRFLSLSPPEGLPIIPVFEGWIANPDGTTSFSYGIINRNDVPVDIPLGENNYMDPAKYSGVQPTHFPPGRSTGVFTVTVPAAEQDIDVWWHLKTGNSEVLKVPGRRGRSAYELDFILPRPQGALQPLVGLGEDGAASPGLSAWTADFPGNPVRAGEQVEIVLNVTDPAVRDETDPRFGEPLDMGVQFNKFQGPGEITWTRHVDSVVPTNPYREGDPRYSRWSEPEANESSVKGPSGIVKVYATFSEPGEYMIHTKVDIHSAPDSSDGDQCCWSNVFQRVTVE